MHLLAGICTGAAGSPRRLMHTMEAWGGRVCVAWWLVCNMALPPSTPLPCRPDGLPGSLLPGSGPRALGGECGDISPASEGSGHRWGQFVCLFVCCVCVCVCVGCRARKASASMCAVGDRWGQSVVGGQAVDDREGETSSD